MRRGLAPSRHQAQADIAAGRVTVSGALADKAARLVDPSEPVQVLATRPRYVGRGGEKLAAALERFDLEVTGTLALDAGASTGGFTDCLLQAGAARVLAVDVGYGQMHERLRGDDRVEVRERTNVRELTVADVPRPVDLVVADLSFISLRAVLPALLGVCRSGADLVLLVKPQFEAGRDEAARARGVIRDAAVWRRTLGEVVDALEAAGASIMDAMPSPLRGADGNVEFLLHARAGESTTAARPVVVDLDAVVASVGEG